MLYVSEKIQIPLREFRFNYVRASGPGGQHVNKVNTKVQLRWNLSKTTSLPEDLAERFRTRFRRQISGNGELILSSQRYRDQARNVADVLTKLANMIRTVQDPPRVRKPTRVSQRQKQKRLQQKRRQSEKKQQRRSLD